MDPESRCGLRPELLRTVVVRGDLDVDAPASPGGVDVLDLRVGKEDPPRRVDREAEFGGGAVPLGLGCPSAEPVACGLAPSEDGAAELALEPDAPDPGAAPGEALPFPSGRPVDGRVVERAGLAGT